MDIEEALRWVDRNCTDAATLDRLRSRKVAKTLADEVERLRNSLQDTHATSPKPHEIRDFINELRDCAVQFHNFQILREKIAKIVKDRIGWLEVSEKAELERIRQENERLKRSEFICGLCGIRQPAKNQETPPF